MRKDSAHWHRIEPLLDRLFSAAPHERARLIEELAGTDDEIRRELASLLAAHVASGEFLERPAILLAPPDVVEQSAAIESPGQVIGRYRLIERIARGGMGTVWLASRADGQFEQRVALKLVKRGMDTDEIIARFLRERQILARLQHPHIARLLDGGISDDGRPYFVMEYVLGVPITQYCRDRALSVNERLQLIETVCHAVQYAHRSLVVHRDLKPSNVLVTESGDVQLLDFGIAKLLDEDESTTLTGWSRPYTPEYATPEQLTGEPITTACDVYQLGLLLHEVLTSTLPYKINRRDIAAARRLICDEEPPAPSTLTGYASLRGDLDTIVLTALKKRPEARYQSADALANDLARFRRGRPISVRGASTMYRATKFVKRNRLRITAGTIAVATVLLITGAYATRIRQDRDRAVLAATKAGQSEEFIRQFFQGWNPVAADRQQVSVDDQLALATRRAQNELAASPELQARMFSLLGSLYTNVGRYAVADSLLQRAARLQLSLGEQGTADVAATQSRQGTLYLATGRHRDAEVVLRNALRLNRALFGDGHPESLRSQYQLVEILAATDRWSDAKDELTKLLSIDGAQTPVASLVRAQATTFLGYALFQQARFAEARDVLAPALVSQRREFGEMSGVVLGTSRALASVLRDIGDLDASDSLYLRAHRIATALYGPDHRETDVSEFVLTIQRQRIGNLVAAESLARVGIKRSEELAIRPRTWEWQQWLGIIALDREHLAEAEPLLWNTLNEIPALFPGGHQSAGDMLNRLAYIAYRLKRANADSVYRAAIAWRAARKAGTPEFVTDGQHYLAWAMLNHGDTADAAAMFRLSDSLYTGRLPKTHSYVVSTALGLKAVARRR